MEKTNMLFDYFDKITIVDSTFARKAECAMDKI